MKNIFLHETRGDYDIAQQRIRLNFKLLAGDPIQTQLTMFHEWVHRLLADTDYGQATHTFYRLLPSFSTLSKTEVTSEANLLYDNQHFVQEGFATFIQYGRLLNIKGKETAEQWKLNSASPDYASYLDRMIFIFDLAQEERDLFIGKISNLAMETGIRREAVEVDIFQTAQSLESFLKNENNSPNSRLSKLIEAIKKDKKLLQRDPQEIAEVSKISYNNPSTKEEVATFVNYLLGFTSFLHRIKPEDIKDALPAAETISQSMKNLVVTNLSMNFVDSSMVEFNRADFLHYADQMEVIFATFHDETWQQWSFLKSKIGKDPEIGLIGFLPDGSKIITFATIKEAIDIINDELRQATFISHWSLYNAQKNRIVWSDAIRNPDIVFYDTVENMDLMLKAVTNSDNLVQFQHLHAAIMEDHPLQTGLHPQNDTPYVM